MRHVGVLIAIFPILLAGQAPAGTTVFEGARLIVGDGQPPIENAAFVVTGDRIVQVGRAGEAKVPQGATRVSLTGKTVMPAIVDTHTHLSQTREALTEDLRRRAYYGVSAAMSLGQDAGDLPFQMRAQTLPGAARFFTAGRGITMPEPGRSEVPYWITSVDEGRKAVQELAAQKVDIVKIWVDDRDGKYKKLTPDLYGPIIEEAHKRGLRVTAHIFTLDDAKGLLRAGIDAFAHGVRDRDIDEEGLALLQEASERGGGAEPPGPRRQDRRELAPRQPSRRGVQEAAGGRDRSAGAPGAVRHPGAQPGKAERGRRADRAWDRRQHTLVSASRDGRHGGVGHDADAGDRRSDAKLRGVPANERCRHDRRQQER